MTTVKALRLNTDLTTEVFDLSSGEDGYTQLHDAVGGYIELVTLSPNLIMYVNEEGKIHRLPYNELATSVWATYYGLTDTILGNAVLVGPIDDEGEHADLSLAVIRDTEKFAGVVRELRHGQK